MSDISREYCEKCTEFDGDKLCKPIINSGLCIHNHSETSPFERLSIDVPSELKEETKAIHIFSMAMDMFDLTHNQEKAVAEWVWMAYGRGGDQ
jgi:hypothetical protein